MEGGRGTGAAGDPSGGTGAGTGAGGSPGRPSLSKHLKRSGRGSIDLRTGGA